MLEDEFVLPSPLIGGKKARLQLTSVKDQGYKCNSCWAFVIATAIECQLVDLDYYNQGCSGGFKYYSTVTIDAYQQVPNDERAVAHQPVAVAIDASGFDFQFQVGIPPYQGDDSRTQAMEDGEASTGQEIILTTLLCQEQDIKEIKALLQEMTATLNKLPMRLLKTGNLTHNPQGKNTRKSRILIRKPHPVQSQVAILCMQRPKSHHGRGRGNQKQVASPSPVIRRNLQIQSRSGNRTESSSPRDGKVEILPSFYPHQHLELGPTCFFTRHGTKLTLTSPMPEQATSTCRKLLKFTSHGANAPLDKC
ncbi:hypothetical protein HHK36_019969 [Tetracentron sinense]|uniref:Peptidase C1A papain C-terminal domain-containing protein n=1 Tax=Tetracentron sinense TaxID=13715 RepID=A0A834YY67_TETSI|nr:hypothetical protein HHK36_019969 [Tetracentron sinense]